jgi:hypothetical protein
MTLAPISSVIVYVRRRFVGESSTGCVAIISAMPSVGVRASDSTLIIVDSQQGETSARNTFLRLHAGRCQSVGKFAVL